MKNFLNIFILTLITCTQLGCRSSETTRKEYTFHTIRPTNPIGHNNINPPPSPNQYFREYMKTHYIPNKPTYQDTQQKTESQKPSQNTTTNQNTPSNTLLICKISECFFIDPTSPPSKTGLTKSNEPIMIMDTSIQGTTIKNITIENELDHTTTTEIGLYDMGGMLFNNLKDLPNATEILKRFITPYVEQRQAIFTNNIFKNNPSLYLEAKKMQDLLQGLPDEQKELIIEYTANTVWKPELILNKQELFVLLSNLCNVKINAAMYSAYLMEKAAQALHNSIFIDINFNQPDQVEPVAKKIIVRYTLNGDKDNTIYEQTIEVNQEGDHNHLSVPELLSSIDQKNPTDYFGILGLSIVDADLQKIDSAYNNLMSTPNLTDEQKAKITQAKCATKYFLGDNSTCNNPLIH